MKNTLENKAKEYASKSYVPSTPDKQHRFILNTYTDGFIDCLNSVLSYAKDNPSLSGIQTIENFKNKLITWK